KILFPDKYIPSVERRYPDYDYIDKEMMRNGVTLKLLWNEYCEECRQIDQLPLMYSQFCFHYQKYREKNRATMHIPRKPGELINIWIFWMIHLNIHRKMCVSLNDCF
ncbi:MAG: hypothetical protein SPF99_06120, partial [Anaerobutyricum sp.]|nr:hypothetical protein [Anaerobutyricum sp.]